MKLILLTLLVLICAWIPPVCSQTFTTQTAANGDTAYANGTATLTVHNDIKSTGSPVTLIWNVSNYSSNISSSGTDWTLDGVCDNILCYSGAPLLAGKTYTTDPYSNLNFSTFYALLGASGAPVNTSAWVQVYIRDASMPSSSKTLTFIGTKNATGIAQATLQGEGLQLFPNPASHSLFVSIPDNKNLNSVSVYSMEGKEVLVQRILEKGVIVIAIDHLSSGSYFLRFKDSNGSTVATRKFMH